MPGRILQRANQQPCLGPAPAVAQPPAKRARIMQAVMMELRKARPTIKLLYVTPERLVKGTSLLSALG